MFTSSTRAAPRGPYPKVSHKLLQAFSAPMGVDLHGSAVGKVANVAPEAVGPGTGDHKGAEVDPLNQPPLTRALS